MRNFILLTILLLCTYTLRTSGFGSFTIQQQNDLPGIHAFTQQQQYLANQQFILQQQQQQAAIAAQQTRNYQMNSNPFQTSACAIPLPSAAMCADFTSSSFSSSHAFTPAEGDYAISRGWSARWASLVTGEALNDPLDELNRLQKVKNLKEIEVEVDERYAREPNQVNDAASTSTSSIPSSLTDQLYSWPPLYDRIFDAEHSEFDSTGSGWNDAAVEVLTNLGLCRGQNQPGHKIYCARPQSSVTVMVGVMNTGVNSWSDENVKMMVHALDYAVWSNPGAKPVDLNIDLDLDSLDENAFLTSAASIDAYSHALSPVSMKLVWTSSQGDLTNLNNGFGSTQASGLQPCVAPGDKAIYQITVLTPSESGIYPLRFSLLSPCGRLMSPFRINVESTCSDGLFCNGYERYVNGVCQIPSTDMTRGCDDGDECTQDHCDETLGRCTRELHNRTECHSSICGGEKCSRHVAAGVECGGDGCGGSAGICQTGEACTVEGKCMPQTQTTASCANPIELDVFQNPSMKGEWTKEPKKFRQGSLDPSLNGDSFPSELSRHFLTIPDVNIGYDSVSPACVSFGTRPDFIWKFEVPVNSVIGKADAGHQTAAAMNIDPEANVLRRDGFIGLNVQAYGKYDPRIDTVIEVRGVAGLFTADSKDEPYTVHDTIFACMDDLRKVNNTPYGTSSNEAATFILQSTTMQRAQQRALDGSIDGSYQPMRPFAMCSDNATPPGGLGSQLAVILPPGTYYLIISSYPRFNIPASVQSILDSAAPSPIPNTPSEKMGQVEAFVRFTSGYLPDCMNQACGDDGGGNDCGNGCAVDELCSTTTSKCVKRVCQPSCQGRKCGSDGCGGVCGVCSLSSLPPDLLLHTPNPLGTPFTHEDVYCLEERDPSQEVFGPAAVGRHHDTNGLLGPSSCALMPRTCDGARPVCYGMKYGTSGIGDASIGIGCPSNTFCANNCSCLPLDAPLPDLLVQFDALLTQVSLSSFSFSNRSCSLVEKCIQRSGLRKLLRFSVAIVNQGNADLVLPKPRSQPDEFVYSPCHHHYHYHHFADYSLIQSGQVKQRGHKQAFCLEDSNQELIGRDVPCLAHHTCTSPGIQRGWTDYYGADLDCQWIDITDLPSGKYYLRIEVNSARQLIEKTFENNVVTVEVNIPN